MAVATSKIDVHSIASSGAKVTSSPPTPTTRIVAMTQEIGAICAHAPSTSLELMNDTRSGSLASCNAVFLVQRLLFPSRYVCDRAALVCHTAP